MKKKKKRQRYCPKEKREEKKMWRLDETHVQVHMSIFVNQEKMYTPPSFFPILGRKHFGGGPREKTLGPHHFLPSPPSNQTPTKKVFLPIFSSKFSIHPISSLNKHTLNLLNCHPQLGDTQTHQKVLLLVG